MTMVRDDGGIIDAELIRPWAWIRSHRIGAGKPLPMNIPELQVTGVAIVTSIGECPTIAEGEGSVITARFLTRQVEVIARAEILGADGSIEVLEGTTIHPIWSVDRNDWVPLGELEPGEQLLGQAGPATVLSVAIANHSFVVYNIEVFGEHVYQVGELGALVHNTCDMGNVVIGKMESLAQTTSWNLGETLLLLKKTSKWEDNEVLLRKAMDQGKPIRDLDPFVNTGFLKLEHELLDSSGWIQKQIGNSWYWLKP
jgi:hypothetical protein